MYRYILFFCYECLSSLVGGALRWCLFVLTRNLSLGIFGYCTWESRFHFKVRESLILLANTCVNKSEESDVTIRSLLTLHYGQQCLPCYQWRPEGSLLNRIHPIRSSISTRREESPKKDINCKARNQDSSSSPSSSTSMPTPLASTTLLTDAGPKLTPRAPAAAGVVADDVVVSPTPLTLTGVPVRVDVLDLRAPLWLWVWFGRWGVARETTCLRRAESERRMKSEREGGLRRMKAPWRGLVEFGSEEMTTV